jgi:hypothetical protein
MNLLKSDEIVIMRHNGEDYIALALIAEAPFTYNPGNVSIVVKPEYFTAKEDEHVNTDDDQTVSFSNGSVIISALHINGPRPSNIVKRK